MIFVSADGKVDTPKHAEEMGTPKMNGEQNQDQNKEQWMKLCEQAAIEQDPERLITLTKEICRLLEEREALLKKRQRN